MKESLDEQRKKQYRIAVIPGDGIGKEVVPEGLRVLEPARKSTASACISTISISRPGIITKSTAR